MRYFIELAYNGINYFGWQRQPNQITVQETIEQALRTILRQPKLEIVGCGRTDTAVHAKQYFAHFNFDGDFPQALTARLNKFLPKDIAIRSIFPVADDHHARFDAYHRAYEYHISCQKDPFNQGTSLFLHKTERFDQDLLQQAAAVMMEYDHFFPFCKTHSDAKTMRCEMHRSEWELGPNHWVFHIAANRFLRGMVRLTVGMCLSVAEGKITTDDVRRALDKQERLEKSLSIAPDGLYLTDIRYPYLNNYDT